MQDETPVNVDTTNDTDTTVNDSLTAEEKLAALEEQNKKLYARAKKAEGFVQDDSGNWVKKEVKPKADISEVRDTARPSDILRSPEFVLHREGYNEDEIDIIMKNGGREILKNEKHPITLGLKAAREQRIAEEAAGKLGDKSGTSDVERKYTEAQMRAMKKEDLEKLIGYAN